MLLGGIWYQRMPGQRNPNKFYKFLTDSPPTYAYSHSVLKAKFPMLLIVTHKSNPRFSMPIDVQNKI